CSRSSESRTRRIVTGRTVMSEPRCAGTSTRVAVSTAPLWPPTNPATGPTSTSRERRRPRCVPHNGHQGIASVLHPYVATGRSGETGGPFPIEGHQPVPTLRGLADVRQSSNRPEQPFRMIRHHLNVPAVASTPHSKRRGELGRYQAEPYEPSIPIHLAASLTVTVLSLAVMRSEEHTSELQ